MSDNLVPKRNGRLKKVLGWFALFLIGAVVVVALLFTLFPKTFNMDRISRFFSYLGRENDEDFGLIAYDANATNDYAAFADGMLVGSSGGLTLFDISGGSTAVAQGSLPEPIVECCDKLGVCYSPGSSYLAGVTSDGEIVFDQNLQGTVTDADLNADGWFCCLTLESGAKSAATVYNPSQEACFRLSSRTQYLNVCAVSPNGGCIAVVGLGELDGAFRSVLTVLRTDEALQDLDGKDSSALRLDLGNEVVYDMKFLSDERFCVVGQTKLRFYDVSGSLLSEQSYAEGSLRDFDFGSGFLIAAFRRNQGGDDYTLTAFDPTGAELGSAELTDHLRNVSAAGSNLAVLTDQGIELYNSKLQRYNRSGTAFAATAVLARPDGTAFLVGNSRTRLYVP